MAILEEWQSTEIIGTDLTYNYTSWMKDNNNSLGDLLINQLTLPGTHNSGAYKLMSTPIWKHPQAGRVNFAMKYVPFVKRIISHWTVTQDKSVKQQLEHGVRALDLRVSFNEKDQQFYISHTFACAKLDDILMQIREFMQENKGEVIVVAIKPDWENRQGVQDHEDELLSRLQDKLGNLLCANNNGGDFSSDNLKINSMVARNERVLICYGGNIPRSITKIWPAHNFTNHWLDKTTATEWEKEFDSRDIKAHPQNLTNVPLVLTPNDSYIKSNAWRHFLPIPGRSLRYMAQSVQNLISSKILKKNDLGGCIISTDFVSDATVEQIIKYNVTMANEKASTLELQGHKRTTSFIHAVINSIDESIKKSQKINDNVLYDTSAANDILANLVEVVKEMAATVTRSASILQQYVTYLATTPQGITDSSVNTAIKQLLVLAEDTVSAANAKSVAATAAIARNVAVENARIAVDRLKQIEKEAKNPNEGLFTGAAIIHARVEADAARNEVFLKENAVRSAEQLANMEVHKAIESMKKMGSGTNKLSS